jgi:tripartite-type tricarboxylate transporter receptor subunit TctC
LCFCLGQIIRIAYSVLPESEALQDSALPDVPTMAEVGVKDFVMTFWSGVVAPAHTPKPIIDKLNQVISTGLCSVEVQEIVGKIGAEVRPGTTPAFQGFIASESKKWRDVVELAAIEKQ